MMMSEFIERVGFEPTAAEIRKLKESIWDAMLTKTSSVRNGKRMAASSG